MCSTRRTKCSARNTFFLTRRSRRAVAVRKVELLRCGHPHAADCGRGRERSKPGTRTDAMVSWIDILPTLVEVAGGTPPQGIDGRSFAGVLRGRSSDASRPNLHDAQRRRAYEHLSDAQRADAATGNTSATCIRSSTTRRTSTWCRPTTVGLFRQLGGRRRKPTRQPLPS